MRRMGFTHAGEFLRPVSPLTISVAGGFLTDPGIITGLIGYYDMYVTSDAYLYVSSQKRGSLMCFHVSDPANIAYVGEGAAISTDCRYVGSADGNTIYVACLSGNSIAKFDVSGRVAPSKTGILTDATNLKQVLGLVVKSSTLGFCCGIGASSSSGSGIINSLDLSSTNPAITQTVSDVLLRNAQYCCLAGTGNKFLVVTGVGGGGSVPNVTVWDVSTPSAMTYVTKYDFPGGAQNPIYSNGYLYVPYTDSPTTGRFLAVLSMDASTGALALVGTSRAGVGQKTTKVGNYIWGCGQATLSGFATSGIWAVEVSDPANPYLAYVSQQNQSEARPIFFPSGGSTLFMGEDTGKKLHAYTISPTS